MKLYLNGSVYFRQFHPGAENQITEYNDSNPTLSQQLEDLLPSKSIFISLFQNIISRRWIVL